MPQTDNRIDEYIARSADFAKPILHHLRQLVHKACPEVTETIKWSFPNFEYAGRILCSMASFKEHCSFGFWLGSLMKDSAQILENMGDKTSMGHLGRIKSLDELPGDKVIIQYIKEAMKLTYQGVKAPKKQKSSSTTYEVPSYLTEELKKNKIAFQNFMNFSPSQKKEYIEWITEAKSEATRNKRLSTAVEWMQEGKVRNWKYLKC